MKSQFSDFQFYSQVISNLKNKERTSLSTNSLSNHSIDSFMRSRMINWMVEVCMKFEFSVKVFFLSVKILDKYLQSTFLTLSSNDIHLIGVTCMFLASKFEDVAHYSLKVFVTRIARDRFSPEDVKKLEQNIVITLLFELDLVVCCDFLSLICKIYGISQEVQKNAEDFLISIQIIYDLQLLPSDEAVIAIFFAFRMHQICVPQEIVALFTGVDFWDKLRNFKGNFVRNREVLKKMTNPQVFRKFDIEMFYCLLQSEEI